MKYAVIFCNGLADRRSKVIKGKTVMSSAKTPNIDFLSSESEVGILKITDRCIVPKSETAVLSVIGYDPKKHYKGSSALEALGRGVEFSEEDVVFYCNLLSLSDKESYGRKHILGCIEDITEDESKELFELLKKNFENDIFKFYFGSDGKYYVVWKKGEPRVGNFNDPKALTEKIVSDCLPKGDFTWPVLSMMKKSHEILSESSVNQKRIENQELPINLIWIWGEGTKPRFESFESKFGIKGSVVSGTDYTKGIGKLADMRVCSIEPVSENIEDNYKDIAEKSLKELKNGSDLVFVHIEEPNYYSMIEDSENRLKSIELIDGLIIGKLVNELESSNEPYRIVLLSGYAASLMEDIPSSEPVPYLIFRSDKREISGVNHFDEKSAASTGIFIKGGYNLMNKIIKK